MDQALTRWSLELDGCNGLDGTFVTGSILETIESPVDDTPRGEEKSATLHSARLVSVTLSAADCQTIVETLATLLQLRWIFERHPTTTIYSILSAQQGVDTGRDFLLLKGVLTHGLTNELEFRIQQQGGSSMTRNDVEDRICLLTKMLFKHLQDQKTKVERVSLKRKYSALMDV